MLATLPSRRLRLAFFGTPELARIILQAVLDAGEDDVVLAVCQPDKPKGRGKIVEPPPVKVLAGSRQIPVVQPVKMRDGSLLSVMKDADLDLAIVAAFGRILPQELLDAPRAGCWNVHASLLPRHRGASPIQHAILSGDTESGVTLMQMTAGLDEGPMLLRSAFTLAPDESAASLTERVSHSGAALLLEGLRLAKETGLDVTPQDPALVTYAPIIAKEDGRLDLTQPAEVLERRVRALNPWPGTWIDLPSGEPLRILRAKPMAAGASAEPGTLHVEAGTLALQTSAGVLQVLDLQPAGKRPMTAAEYLRGAGRALTNGMILPHR